MLFFAPRNKITEHFLFSARIYTYKENNTYERKFYNEKDVSCRFAAVLTTGVFAAAADNPYKITIGLDKKEIGTSNLPSAPYLRGNTLMLPLRIISEGLGYTVTWDPETETITVDDDYIQYATLREGSADAVFTGRLKVIDMSRKTEMPEKAEIIDGHTYVSSDFFREFLNDVVIDGETVSVSPSMAQID